MLETWSGVLSGSFRDVWYELARLIPKTIAAIVFFAIGWIVGSVLGGVVSHVIRALRVDKALQGLGIEEPLARAGLRLDTGLFLGTLVQWFFVLVSLLISFDVLGLPQVNEFLSGVLLVYLPNVLVASIVLILAAIVADMVSRVVTGSAKAAGYAHPHFASGVARWAILLFSVLVALSQLGIAEQFAQTLWSGLVAMLALAGGLAFGLGGKDAAARFLERLRADISKGS